MSDETKPPTLTPAKLEEIRRAVRGRRDPGTVCVVFDLYIPELISALTRAWADREQAISDAVEVMDALEDERNAALEASAETARKYAASVAEVGQLRAELDAAGVAGLEQTRELETLRAELNMAICENAELAGTRDAVARALGGQPPGPLDMADSLVRAVAKLLARVAEYKSALKDATDYGARADQRVADMETALRRLASSEAFAGPLVLDVSPLAYELRLRMRYAEAAIPGPAPSAAG